VKRYACVHGHFYQPPRENPWTGQVERQPSAGRDHDWNARIARECYGPNAEARVVDGQGRLADLVDNYEHISFDFGPTLLSWLERERPALHQRIVDADRAAVRRLGHGSAMAQAYHHAILPLCSPRDRRTELLWGLADFKRRFGRDAEGLWLPECAADDATLREAVSLGVKFVLLEPGQAAEAVSPGVPYKWKGGDLALFFYDGGLSRAVAFERAMSHSGAFADRMLRSVPATAEDGLCLLATDGESYGHHEAFAEMGLAHLLTRDLPQKGVKPVNIAWYLAKHPPRKEVSLKAGATSWSCAHGVERWRSDCGCGRVGDSSLAWRAPLRAALSGLKERLDGLYEKAGPGWPARDAYIELQGEHTPAAEERWLAAHAPGRDVSRTLTALEMQRHALMMFTSCGWFFDSVERLEPVQILQYAARALELARALGEDLEPGFMADLKKVPSVDYGDGVALWNRLVLEGRVGADEAAAHLAVEAVLAEAGSGALGWRASVERINRRAEGGISALAGRALFSREGGAPERRCFVAAVLPGQRVQAFVCGGELPDEGLDALLSAAARGQEVPLPPGRVFLLRDLRPDARERVLGQVLKRRLVRWEAGARDQLEEALPLLEQYRGLGLPPPAGLSDEARVLLGHALADAARKFAEGSPNALSEISGILKRAASAGLDVPSARAEEPFGRGIERVLGELEASWEPFLLEELRAAAAVAASAGISEWMPAAQARFFRLLKTRGNGTPEASAAAAALSVAVPH
jgi:alpha-amylase/alpha-mannosidase (GH57 family)